MKETKFKAWDKENKKMVSVISLHDKHYLSFCVYSTSQSSDGITELDYDKCELMQFTGLKDRNGKEIFEGDVLQINPKGLKYFIVQSFILDTYTLWKMIAERLNNPMKKYTKIEVIGNIYENPELLEDKK